MPTPDTRSPHLGLPYLAPAQALKHITHNEALMGLDDIVQLAVERGDAASPPTSPVEGVRYIIASGAQGVWAGKSGQIAVRRSGAWQFRIPQAGWRAFNRSENALWIFDGSEWQSIALDQSEAAQFGINTQADLTNRLAIKSDAVLHSHDDLTPGTGDARHVLNKIDAAHTGAFLFQSGYTGHAEIGLLGNQNFTLNVSPDGSQWITAMIIDHQTGLVTFPANAAAQPQGLPDGYSLYVDPDTGDDAFNGARETPFATLTPLRNALNSHSGSAALKAFISGALYEDQHLGMLSLAGPAELTFDSNTEIRWTSGTFQSAITAGSHISSHLTLFGHGLIISGFQNAASQGLGALDNTLIAHDVIVRNCGLGASGSGAAHIETHNCRFEQSVVASLLCQGSATSEHVDSYFQSGSTATDIIEVGNAQIHRFEHCEIESADGMVQILAGGANTSLINCRIGSLANAVDLSGTLSIQESFVHGSGEGNDTLTLTRAFGRLSVRLRNGGGININNCVLDGSIAAGGDFLFSNYDPGSFSPVHVDQSVITGFSTAVRIGVASRLQHWQNAGSTMADNILFGNTVNFGSQIQTEVGLSITGTDTNAPSIGARDTLVMSDWAVSGTVAGFTAAQAVPIGIRAS